MEPNRRQQAHDALQDLKQQLNASFDPDKILETILAFIAYMQESEKLLIIAIERAQKVPPTYAAPTSGGAEFGWLPYLFKHVDNTGTTDPLVQEFQDGLKEVFGKYAADMEKVLYVIGLVIDPQITKSQWDYLEANMKNSSIIANDGTIVGDGKYEDLDKGWLYPPANYLLNLVVPKSIAPFTPPASQPTRSPSPYNGPIGDGAESIKIAIIGDWGTGDYDASPNYKPAAGVLQAVENLNPDYVIHLGDVYYCGTDLRYPPGEEASNFLEHWPHQFAGKSFTLNSNHEMYGGAQGYFDVALNRKNTKASPFCLQNGYSYFALEFGNWVLVGMDAAYHDTSALYMQGGIGTSATLPQDSQLEFLQTVATQYKGKKIILLSHQTGMSTDGSTVTDYPLLAQVEATGLNPDYWYWGHIHLGLVYGTQSAVNTASAGRPIKARCVGHSAIPFGNPWGLTVGHDIVDFIANTPVANSSLAHNGLAMLTLTHKGGITEQFFDGISPGSTDMPMATWTRSEDMS